jgi:hypothetical protein
VGQYGTRKIVRAVTVPDGAVIVLITPRRVLWNASRIESSRGVFSSPGDKVLYPPKSVFVLDGMEGRTGAL